MRPSPMIAHSGDVSTVKRTWAVSVALVSAALAVNDSVVEGHARFLQHQPDVLERLLHFSLEVFRNLAGFEIVARLALFASRTPAK